MALPNRFPRKSVHVCQKNHNSKREASPTLEYACNHLSRTTQVSMDNPYLIAGWECNFDVKLKRLLIISSFQLHLPRKKRKLFALTFGMHLKKRSQVFLAGFLGAEPAYSYIADCTRVIFQRMPSEPVKLWRAVEPIGHLFSKAFTEDSTNQKLGRSCPFKNCLKLFPSDKNHAWYCAHVFPPVPCRQMLSFLQAWDSV